MEIEKGKLRFSLYFLISLNLTCKFICTTYFSISVLNRSIFKIKEATEKKQQKKGWCSKAHKGKETKT